MKRLIYCFDGTWNQLTKGFPSNIPRIAQAIRAVDDRDAANPIAQIVFYDEGVGTFELGKYLGWIVNRLSGALGLGVEQNILQAYTHLILNYAPGDEIYIFGFSRGAFTARSFGGLIGKAGIMRKSKLFAINQARDLYRNNAPDRQADSDFACAFRQEHSVDALLPSDITYRTRNGTMPEAYVDLTITYMGIFDTVGAMGVPESLLIANIVNRKHSFHDTDLSPIVGAARHVVAADEKRRNFRPTLWSNLGALNAAKGGIFYRQRIFPGTHSGVGGGGPIRGLSDRTLEWVLVGALKAGLNVDIGPDSPLGVLKPDFSASIFNEAGKTGWGLGDLLLGGAIEPRDFDDFQITQDTAEYGYEGKQEPCELDEFLFDRWHRGNFSADQPRYRPQSLKKFWPMIEYLHDPDIDHKDSRPDAVIRHSVSAGEDWSDIADQYYAESGKGAIIAEFNITCRIITAAEDLHNVRHILVPIWRPEI